MAKKERKWPVGIMENGKLRQRSMTVAELRAALDARAAMARPIAEAFRRGDMKGVEEAQKAMRERYG